MNTFRYEKLKRSNAASFCELNVHVFCCCVSNFLIYILSANNGERVIFENIFAHFLSTFNRKKNYLPSCLSKLNSLSFTFKFVLSKLSMLSWVFVLNLL